MRRAWAAVAAVLFVGWCALPAGAAARPAATVDGDTTPTIVVGTVKRLDADHFRIDIERILPPGHGVVRPTKVMTTDSFSGDDTCRWLTEKIPPKRLYLVDITVRRDGPLLDECTDIRAKNPASLKLARRELRATVSTPTTPPTVEVTTTPVHRSDAPEFTRLAAPGLAVVIIGLLGLFVVRRVDRP